MDNQSNDELMSSWRAHEYERYFHHNLRNSEVFMKHSSPKYCVILLNRSDIIVSECR